MTLLLALVAQAGDNPEFPYWKNHRIGATASYALELTQQGQPAKGEMTRTLLQIGSDACVVERKGRITTAERTVDFPAEKETVKAREDKAVKIVKDAAEDVEVAGRTLTCRYLETEKDEGGVKTFAKIWAHEEIPGGVAKAEVTRADGSTMKLRVTSWTK
jgi:hypothetical protein